MTMVIPYNSSLILGNLVDNELLDNLQQISKEQNSVDVVQDKLNSLMTMKRSFEMTIQEVLNL